MANLELIEALKLERNKLLDKVKSIDQTILVMQQSFAFENNGLIGDQQRDLGSKQVNKDYPIDKSLKAKIVHILKSEQRFLHVREIAEILNANEPSISIDEFKGKSSQSLSQLKGSENSKITSMKIGTQNQNNFWGSKDWIDENNNIKKDFIYNPKYLMENNKEEIDF